MSRISDKRRAIIMAMAEAGDLTPSRLRDDARNPGHPLHDDPKWLWDDDAEAAELYRENYGRELIQSIYVVLEHVTEPVRALVSLSSDRPGQYRRIVDVLSDDDMRQQLLRDCRSEALAFVRKYQRVRTVAGAGDLLDAIGALAAALPDSAVTTTPS